MTPQANIASIRKQIDREIVPEEAVLQGGGYKVMSTSTKAETETRDRGCFHSRCSVECMCVCTRRTMCVLSYYWYLLVLILLFTVSSPSLYLLHPPPGASGGIIKRSQEAGWTVLSHCTRTIHGTERVMVLFLDEVGGTAGIDGTIGAQSAAAASAATGGTNRAVPGAAGAVVSAAGASESAFGEAAFGAGRRSLGTLNPVDMFVAVGDWDTASPRLPLLVGASEDSKHNDHSEHSESSELTQDETDNTYASELTDGSDNTDSFVDNTMLGD